MNKRLFLNSSLIGNLCLLCLGATGYSYTVTIGEKPAAARSSLRQEAKERELELKIHELINRERQRHGLSCLTWNETLHRIAKGHSTDMGRRDYFEHTSPEGHNFRWRYEQAGFCETVEVGNYIYYGAENIFQGWTFGTVYYVNGEEVEREWHSLDTIAEKAVSGWMQSAGHRKNILAPQWLREGIGVFITAEGKVFVTQNFC